jgi:hypothetical protein
MKDPTRWMQRTFRKTATAVAKAGRALRNAGRGLTETVDRAVEKLRPVASEILITWVGRLIVTVAEITIAWLLRQVFAPPKRSNVLPFPVLRPAS